MASIDDTAATTAGPQSATGDALAARVLAVHDAVRTTTPLVHCVTNYVAMDVTANVLLAAGASPAMVHAQEEAGEFAGLASALSINIGTLSPPWVAGMQLAVEAATRRGIPWVLDPVAVGATSYRTQAGTELLAMGPTVVRANAGEVLALRSGAAAAGSRGVDSTASVDQAGDAARWLARTTGCVVAMTGQSDFVTDGTREVVVHGGDARMPQVTALGCALSSLVAGFCAVHEDPFVASVAALGVFAVAGGRAGQQAQGPGTLRLHLMDELAGLDSARLADGLRLS